MTVADVKRASTRELGTENLFIVPSWGKWTSAAMLQPLEHVPELRWPLCVRETFPRMRQDSQLAGLYRGTTLPILRYVWGVDPNGADPKTVERVCAELGLQTIDDAWASFQTGQSDPVARQRNNFSLPVMMADALKACYLGNYWFEQVYDVEQDGDPGLNGGWFAHLAKLAARAPWTISQFYVDRDGGLTGIRQLTQQMADPPIPVSQLVGFVFDKDPGDWAGNSLFRPCFREWLSKDLLYRIDTVNHEKAGGILLTEAPEGALPAQMQALGELSAGMRVGGGGALPAGSNPVFLRATGSDVIASINQRDEAMARSFLMMFMSLGTSSSGGNRALSGTFVDWFAIAQEAIAIWFRDIFNEHVIKDFVDLNWQGADYVPKLVFKRPEDDNPLTDLAHIATDGSSAGAPVAVSDGATGLAAAARVGRRQVVIDEETLWELRAAHEERERDIQPARTRRSSSARAANAEAAVTALPLPDRPLRRQPTANEVRAAVNFRQVDLNWQSQVDALVSEWKSLVRAAQIEQARAVITAAAGDLTALAQLTVIPAGADLIAGKLVTMANLGVSEAIAEAARQGVAATSPEVAALEAELTARATAVAQLLASSLSQAAANKAVQITGPALAPEDVAAQVADYIDGLSDTYLADQFGGALAAAQNGGRLAAMNHNQAARYYASELLDANTCDPCEEVDGTEYGSADAAAEAYPAGGYRDCQGGPRCRGTVVAVYEEEPSA